MVISVRNISAAQRTECNTKHTHEKKKKKKKTPSKKFNCVKKKKMSGRR